MADDDNEPTLEELMAELDRETTIDSYDGEKNISDQEESEEEESPLRAALDAAQFCFSSSLVNEVSTAETSFCSISNARLAASTSS